MKYIFAGLYFAIKRRRRYGGGIPYFSMRLGFAASCAFTLFNVLMFTNSKWLSILDDPNDFLLSAGLFCIFIMLIVRIYAPESELEKYEISSEEIKIIDSTFILYWILNTLVMLYLISRHR